MGDLPDCCISDVVSSPDQEWIWSSLDHRAVSVEQVFVDAAVGTVQDIEIKTVQQYFVTGTRQGDQDQGSSQIGGCGRGPILASNAPGNGNDHWVVRPHFERRRGELVGLGQQVPPHERITLAERFALALLSLF